MLNTGVNARSLGTSRISMPITQIERCSSTHLESGDIKTQCDTLRVNSKEQMAVDSMKLGFRKKVTKENLNTCSAGT